MKKKLALLLCVILTLGLFVGCKGDKPINTVDTSNTSDTSSKIETETVLDDKYANSEKPFSEYTIEEFEKLDISDKYVMVDEDLDHNSSIFPVHFEEYDFETIFVFDRKGIKSDGSHRVLLKLKNSGKDKVLEAIKSFKEDQDFINARPVSFKEEKKIIPAYKETDSITSETESQKPYSEYTEEEFEKLDFDPGNIFGSVKEDYINRLFVPEDFPEFNISYMRISYYLFDDGRISINYNMILKETKIETLNSIKKLENNEFLYDAAPNLKGYLFYY